MPVALAQSSTVALLDAPGFHFSPTQLTIDSWVEYDEWEFVGRKLASADRSVQWWIGDWIRHGEKAYSEKYSQALELTGLKKQTLMNYAFVCGAFKETSRRREDVDFSTHAEVAGLPASEQDKILDKAAGNPRISSRDVRKEAKRTKKRLKLIPDEIEIIHTEEVQNFLDGYVEVLKGLDEHVPESAVFLRSMLHAHIGQAQWQKDRTIEADYDAIIESFQSGVYTQTEDDIYGWLIRSGYFMSDPDFEERLSTMCRHSVLKDQARKEHRQHMCDCKPVHKMLIKDKQGGRKEGQKGDMVDVYELPRA